MKRLLISWFYVMLASLGLTFLGVAGVVAAHVAFGKATGADLRNMVRVLAGTNRYVVPDANYQRYQEFLADEAKMRAASDELYGVNRERVASQAIEQQARRDLADAVAAGKADIQQEQRTILGLRDQLEVLKTQLDDERKKLAAEKAKNALVEADAMTKKLRATLAAMDAGVLAEHVAGVFRESGADEAARLLREHMVADLGAEVLAEIPEADVRQKIIPLLENKFAGVPPKQAVEVFRRNNMAPAEMAVYLKQMSAPQALGTYLNLTDAERVLLAPILLSNR
jgi:hypothetical protein